MDPERGYTIVRFVHEYIHIGSGVGVPGNFEEGPLVDVPHEKRECDTTYLKLYMGWVLET
jgi:hypothetical protein